MDQISLSIQFRIFNFLLIKKDEKFKNSHAQFAYSHILVSNESQNERKIHRVQCTSKNLSRTMYIELFSIEH